jgi:hypothetical protein
MFVHVDSEPGGIRVIDDTEGEFHLVVVSLGNIKKKHRTPVIRMASNLYSGKIHILGSNYLHQLRKIAVPGNAYEPEKAKRYQAPVNALLFDWIKGVNVSKTRKLFPAG